MGNCVRKESPMQWGGEDWGSPASETLYSGVDTTTDKATKIEEDERLFREDHEKRASISSSSSSSSSSVVVTEVKIKITKKQLEELLGRMDVQGLSLQQVLAHLMSASDRYEISHQRSRRPALQSIPEVN